MTREKLEKITSAEEREKVAQQVEKEMKIKNLSVTAVGMLLVALAASQILDMQGKGEHESTERYTKEEATEDLSAPAGGVVGSEGKIYTTTKVPTIDYTDPVTGEVEKFAPGGAVMNGDNAYITTVTEPIEYTGDVISSQVDSYVNQQIGDTTYEISDDAIGVVTQIDDEEIKDGIHLNK